MYGYGYVSLNNGEAGEEVPFLNTITTPSPSGSGSSTATIYYGSNYFVTGTEDGNGQTVSYAPISGSPGTIVTVSGTGMPQPFSYTESFDSSMRLNWITNGADQPMLYYAYLSGTDVYKPSAESDSNGHTVKYTYDSFGNVITKTSPYGTETTNTYAYTDFALGELVSSEEGSKVATSFSYYEPSGLVQTINAPTPYGITTAQPTVPYNFYYDSLGDLTEVQTPGSTVGSTVTTTYTYGSSPQFGQVLSATDNLGHTKFFTYDDQANVTSATDARGYTTYYGNTSRTGGYNIADQNVLVTYPATGQTGTGNSQQVTTYEYTGGPVESVSATNEAGTTVRTVNYAYGAEGELLGVSGSAPTTTYSYDAMYRPLTVSDGKANVTHYYYNAQGFLDSVTYPGYSGAPAFSPSTGAWYVTGRDSVHYASYDPIGDPGTRVDGRGVVTSYLYSDPANQLTDVSYDVSGAPVASQSAVFLTYDNYGRLATIQNGLTKVQYGFYIGAQYYPGYDDSNRPLCQQVTYYNDESTLFSKDLVRYYNPDGSKSESVLYPYVGSTHYCTYTYDAAQRLASETNPFGQTTSYSYFDNNWLGGVTLEAPSTGPTTSYVPNPLGETTELINRDSNADGDAVGSDFSSIKHDGVGNQTGDSVVFNAYTPYSGSTSYTYDGLDELTDESSTRNSGYNLGFAFDSAQNATTYLNVGGRTFNSDNQLTGAGGSSYGYDGDGNLTSINSTAITYDVEDRMTAVPGSLTNGYGADGSRATSTDLAVGTVYYLYDWDSIAPAFEFSAGGSALAVNTYGLTGLTSRATAATTTYYEFDPQGNVCQRLDINGVTHNASITTGFGTVTNYAPPNDPFGYAAQSGGYTDQTTGLVAMGSRFYMSGIGRFLNRDPIGAAGGTNVYAYTNNNPVNNVDPSGLAKQQDDGGDWAVSMADSTVDPSSRALADIAVPGSCGRQLFSGLADSVAGVVTAPLKAITGQDLIAGTSISPGDRLLAVVMTALEFIPGAGEEAAATGFDRIALGRFNHYVGDGQYEDMLDGFAESHKATSYRNWGYEVEGDMMPSVRDAMSKAKQIYFNMSDIDQDRALSGNYANGAEQELVEILNNEELFDKTNFDYDYVP
jgi:RHS repeat-associated protein